MMSTSGSFAAELLSDARQGSETSLGKLMQLHASYLKLVVASQLDDRLRARVSSSDVVQETFYEAHRDFPAFRGATPEEFLGWLRRILMNNLLRAVEQHLKAAKRDVRREVSLDRARPLGDRSAPGFAAQLPHDGDSPSASFQRRENADTLGQMLDVLPDDYREVLRLRHQEGLDFSEIGERMGRSSGAVRMLWLRSIKRLRSLYDDEAAE
ncbi:ECF RNA polymerase sigma factor SigR [Botrimarina colliarenosi]|uniref:ECF RNA polymerase sigma factor SigR n=1 Tax=Botrimarina colliarenosi TaxID=2528001 RepID=A0A5C6AAG1_9BACT|nr:sigma-70 family RNA polymerase sigma factor [Botrimarina colliarenosi]TWT97014.1 ECF RNA polymerase sigma factor SigR [Botrimarina colliarenosi]